MVINLPVFHAVSNRLRSAEDLVTISGGCVCCSLRKDIITALHELVTRAKSAGVKHDNIILETTGLADPGPVAYTCLSHPWVSKRFSIDSIVYASSLLWQDSA